jgi:glycerol-3-phosphate dehydrogenase (NAD(P)+)
VPIVVLSGPSHAEEVGRDLPTAVVAAGHDAHAATQVQELLMGDRLRVYTNDDVTGVETAGALKNVLAIACGISDGLGFGDNSRAALITRGLREIVQIGQRLGGKYETFIGLSGLGDLVGTCTSRHSRNRRLGELIGQGVKPQEALQRIGMVAEGYYTAQSVVSLENVFHLELPICREIYKIIYEGKSPQIAVNDLMLRERKAEAAAGLSGSKERLEQ